MKYDIRKTSQFKKDFETVVKRGLDINEFRTVLELQVDGATIPEKYKDHPLRNSKELSRIAYITLLTSCIQIFK